MKGFRPGKVPASFLEKQFGADARRQVVENFSQQAFQQAIEEHDLKPVGRQAMQLEVVPHSISRIRDIIVAEK